MTALLGACELGLLMAVMSLGVFLSFRILNVPDLTIDGSFTTGCAVSAVCSGMQMHAFGLGMAVFCGSIAGLVTGILQTKGKIQPILAGILTMTGLYSINLRIMGSKPNLFLEDTLFLQIKELFPSSYSELALILVFLLIVIGVLVLFFTTQLGLALRATGDNEAMVKASSINSDAMIILGLSLANAIVSFSGALFVQYQGFSDINSGTGMMVIGLASVIVGEVFLTSRRLPVRFLSVVCGALLYRFILTFALQLGLEANDMKLLSAVLVIAAISFPHMLRRRHHA